MTYMNRRFVDPESKDLDIDIFARFFYPEMTVDELCDYEVSILRKISGKPAAKKVLG